MAFRHTDLVVLVDPIRERYKFSCPDVVCVVAVEVPVSDSEAVTKLLTEMVNHALTPHRNGRVKRDPEDE